MKLAVVPYGYREKLFWKKFQEQYGVAEEKLPCFFNKVRHHILKISELHVKLIYTTFDGRFVLSLNIRGISSNKMKNANHFSVYIYHFKSPCTGSIIIKQRIKRLKRIPLFSLRGRRFRDNLFSFYTMFDSLSFLAIHPISVFQIRLLFSKLGLKFSFNKFSYKFSRMLF